MSKTNQTDKANLAAAGHAASTSGTEAEQAAARNASEAEAKEKTETEAREKAALENKPAAERREGPLDHKGDKTNYTEEERQARDNPKTFVTSRGHDQVLRQHEEVQRAKDELNQANEEGHAANMERIEKEAEQIEQANEGFVASGLEDNRNTPKINADGSKVWS